MVEVQVPRKTTFHFQKLLFMSKFKTAILAQIEQYLHFTF